MITTPYKHNIEDYHVDVEYLDLELMYHVQSKSDFNHDVWPLILIKGSWIDRFSHTSCKVYMTIVVSGTKPHHTSLRFTGNFTVNKREEIKTPPLGVRLTEYCAELIKTAIIETPIVDKDGNLYPMAHFACAEDKFASAVFE